MRSKKELKSITELARELRNNPTPAERKLWRILRKEQLHGCRFLRQKPIIYKEINSKSYFFIADFYCAKQQLVIELDGKYHKRERQQEYDQNRDFVIGKLGIDVLRIKNDELDNIDLVIEKIIQYLD